MKSRAQRYRYVRHVAMSCFPDGVSAPPTLSYASPQSWTYGAAISTLSPTTTGATSFAVQSGTLPTGVSLNASTGDITGTPTVAKVAANVVIRATGPGGTADATINIAVPSPLYTSLVDYWNLDEASGTRVGSHAGLDLTDNNTVTSQATGGPDSGQCAQFTAANTEYLSRASEAALQTGDIDWTLAVWSYLDSKSAARGLASKGIGGAGDEFLLAYGIFGVDRYNALLFDSGGSSIGTVTANTFGVPPTGAWHYVILDHVAATSTASLAVNNGAKDGKVLTGTLTTGNKAFKLCEYSGVYVPDGRLAYVGFWKRALTAAERTWLYNAGAGRAYSALATYDGG